MNAGDFAADWQSAWNSHDLDRIMAHYDENIIFRSKKAVALVGTGEIKGRTALRDYWAAALRGQPDLKFTVTAIYEGYEMCVIAYRNHKGIEATETLWFNENGIVTRAAACHGI